MNTTVDPFEELARLFLTEPDGQAVSEANGRGPAEGPGGPDGTAARAADVELIVVGSLPVRAVLWMVPYADAIARSVGPTGLIRLDDEAATLQVVRGGSDLTMRRWPSLGEAIADLGGRIRRWVIRPALELSPGDLATAGGQQITILSGANEGAVVEAYGRVKSLVEAARASGAEPPAVGLAVLGAERTRAERAQHQLDRTTSTFLEVGVPLVACVQRMEGTIQVSDCLTFTGSPKPPIRSVLRWIRDAAPAVAPPQPPAAPEPQPTVKLLPKPGVKVEPKGPATALEPDVDGVPVPLAAHVEGLVPLDVRCPGHERLELGIDASGKLHVIARDEQLRELHVVEAWASAHRELIGKACPDHWIDPAAKPVCHVFTQRPAAVADLHGSALRLHVLAPVVVDGKQGWYVAPLNADVR